MAKHFVHPESLKKDSFQLGAKILKSSFRPDVMIALWRGGAPVGCYVHELLKFANLNVDHIAIRTAKYTGVDQSTSTVKVYNLRYLLDILDRTTKVLIVDDISDTGHSVEAVINNLRENLGEQMPEDIKLATIFYKPSRNETGRIPDYYVHATDKWVVFPHELEGRSEPELLEYLGPEIYALAISASYLNSA